ncbi:MAG: CheY-like chemotaxis protein [Alteromonadaceae bacterium]|jgi:CheY-like chemotaxis protein
MEDNALKSSILIVDDSAIALRHISKMIVPLGHKIHVAKSGLQALKLLTTINPTLILMDLGMPDMDGFECCERLKRSAGRAHIPIIFLSGSHDDKDKEKAINLGAKDYITKPVSKDALFSKLAEHMPWAQ